MLQLDISEIIDNDLFLLQFDAVKSRLNDFDECTSLDEHNIQLINAKLEVHSGNYSKALKFVTKLNEIDPSNKSYALTMLLLQRTVNPQGATVVKKMPEHILALLQKCETCFALYNLDALDPLKFILTNIYSTQDNEILEEQTLFAQAVLKEPPETQKTVETAIALLQENKLEEALSELNKSILSGITCEKIYSLTAKICFQIKHLDEAVEYFETALSIKISYEVLIDLGMAYFLQNKLDAAKSCFYQAARFNIFAQEAHFNLGTLFKSQNLTGLAIKHFSIALQMQPTDKQCLVALATLFESEGRIEDSKIFVCSALKIDPTLSEAHELCGKILFDTFLFSQAEASFLKALKYASNKKNSLLNIGLTKFELKDVTSALYYFQRVLEYGEDTQILTLIGQCHLRLGDMQTAAKFFNKAIRLNSPSSFLYTQLALHKIIQGNYQVAEKLLFLALELKVGDPVAVKEMFELCSQSLIGKNKIYSTYNEGNILLKTYCTIHEFLTNPLKIDVRSLSNLIQEIQLLKNKFKRQDFIFMQAYSNLIMKLLKFKENRPIQPRKIHHIGESHCLSYAHQNVTVDEHEYTIEPDIIYGLKMFHLADPKPSRYKAAFIHKIHNIPKSSLVWISVGEIDTRFDEGFLRATSGDVDAIGKLINSVVLNFVKYLKDINTELGHRIFLLNIPAPIYNLNLSPEDNEQVRLTVSLCNDALIRFASPTFTVLDVYNLTKSDSLYSNSLYHIDNIHLAPSILNPLGLKNFQIS